MLRWHVRWRITSLVVAAIAAVGVSSCASNSPSDTPNAATNSSRQSQIDKYLQAQLNRYLAAPSFTAPGPQISGLAKFARASVLTIPVTSDNPFCAGMDNAAQQAAKLVGLKDADYTNDGSSAEWVAGISTAIDEKVTALNLTCGLGPSAVGPQIMDAKKAGVPVVVGYGADVSQPQPPNVAAQVVGLFELPGTLMADWAIAHAQTPLHALVITDNQYTTGQLQVAAIKSQFAKYCIDCTITYKNVDTNDFTTEIEPISEAAILADPKLTYILPIYDPMSPYVIQAINAEGASARVKIATFNGTPSILDDMATGNIVQMDVGESPGWIGYAIIDEDLRLAAGMKPVAKEPVGVRVFDKANVLSSGAPNAQLTDGYGNSFVAGYKALWGLG